MSNEMIRYQVAADMHFKVNIFQIKHIPDTLIQIHMQKKRFCSINFLSY